MLESMELGLKGLLPTGSSRDYCAPRSMLQQFLKPLEIRGRHAGARALGFLLRRPARAALAPSRLGQARRILLVRVDNRVGEALLTTPLLDALRAQRPDLEVDLLVHGKCVRLLEGHPSGVRVMGLDRARLWAGPLSPGVRALRARGYDAVVDCSNWTEPSVTAALVSRFAGSDAVVIGPGTGATRGLRDVPVAPLGGTRSEVAQRLHLLSPLLGPQQLRPLSFRPPRPSEWVLDWTRQFRGPRVVVNPGGRLGYRRVPPGLFAQAVRTLAEMGLSVVLTWGPGEEALASEVIAEAPVAFRAPPTSLDDLAWLMATSVLAVCNNTGPMHLSVAVGTPTLGLFLHMDMERWGHLHAPHHMVDLTAALSLGEAPERLNAELLAWATPLLAHGPTAEPT